MTDLDNLILLVYGGVLEYAREGMSACRSARLTHGFGLQMSVLNVIINRSIRARGVGMEKNALPIIFVRDAPCTSIAKSLNVK